MKKKIILVEALPSKSILGNPYINLRGSSCSNNLELGFGSVLGGERVVGSCVVNDLAIKTLFFSSYLVRHMYQRYIESDADQLNLNSSFDDSYSPNNTSSYFTLLYNTLARALSLE